MYKAIQQSLLEAVLLAAKKGGMGQSKLAEIAGLAPETLSRSKKRKSMEVQTLAALAQAAGLELTVREKQEQLRFQGQTAIGLPSRKLTPPTNPPLSDPRWALSWSSRSPKPEALVRNALKKGNYAPVLQAVLEYGSPFVQKQFEALQAAGELKPSSESGDALAKMLLNIEKGIHRAQA
jgi:transcriptional regulator with XRE-family HTH domain